MLVLSGTDLSRLLPLAQALSAMEEAFSLDSQEYQIPLRVQVPIAGTSVNLLVMPGVARGLGVVGVKVVGVFPENSRFGLPTVRASYLLVSLSDGTPLALMDGAYLTAVRTAATSALATRYMARERPSRLAVFGTGLQARFHLEAMSLVREIAEARVCGTSLEKARSFAAEMRLPFPLHAATAREAVADADIICTCTTSSTPVFDGRRLPQGVHINAVGAYRPNTRELDDATMRRARIVVDTFEGAMEEAGDLLIPLADGTLDRRQIAGTLSEVARGTVAGRAAPEEVTVFKSVGFALEDLVAALRAFRNATGEADPAPSEKD